jgi:hypothetical protein
MQRVGGGIRTLLTRFSNNGDGVRLLATSFYQSPTCAHSSVRWRLRQSAGIDPTLGNIVATATLILPRFYASDSIRSRRSAEDRCRVRSAAAWDDFRPWLHRTGLPVRLNTEVFKTTAIDHSAIPSRRQAYALEIQAEARLGDVGRRRKSNRRRERDDLIFHHAVAADADAADEDTIFIERKTTGEGDDAVPIFLAAADAAITSLRRCRAGRSAATNGGMIGDRTEHLNESRRASLLGCVRSSPGIRTPAARSSSPAAAQPQGLSIDEREGDQRWALLLPLVEGRVFHVHAAGTPTRNPRQRGDRAELRWHAHYDLWLFQ